MADKKSGSKTDETSGLSPKRRERLADKAEKAGVERPVAEMIIEDAVSEGVAPEKMDEVVVEAAQVEKEDQEAVAADDQPDGPAGGGSAGRQSGKKT